MLSPYWIRRVASEKRQEGGTMNLSCLVKSNGLQKKRKATMSNRYPIYKNFVDTSKTYPLNRKLEEPWLPTFSLQERQQVAMNWSWPHKKRPSCRVYHSSNIGNSKHCHLYKDTNFSEPQTRIMRQRLEPREHKVDRCSTFSIIILVLLQDTQTFRKLLQTKADPFATCNFQTA